LFSGCVSLEWKVDYIRRLSDGLHFNHNWRSAVPNHGVSRHVGINVDSSKRSFPQSRK
jgi:hypothetical protein